MRLEFFRISLKYSKQVTVKFMAVFCVLFFFGEQESKLKGEGKSYLCNGWRKRKKVETGGQMRRTFERRAKHTLENFSSTWHAVYFLFSASI